MKSAALLSCLLGLLPAAVPAAAPAPTFAAPRFTDASRSEKIAAVAPQIDRIFTDFAAERHLPGLVWGVVLDGQLVHSGATGWANVERKIPAAGDTRFRIASMTKSFTALAILKLRDAGRLALQDPVARYLPEFARVALPTADAPAITVRHLLTMSAGFPEDNPWGDRQLAVGVKEFADFIRQGLSFSNAPGIAFEYSNLAYALLGQIISQVAGMPYQRYITREVLTPLGMTSTVWEFTQVPADQLALGYRWEDGAWRLEPLLPDGTYGAMGGLLTTMADFTRYVAFHLDAWPARNDPDTGVVRRATRREMHHPAEFTGLVAGARNAAGQPAPFVNAYGYGLVWTYDSEGAIRVGHSGGLPGFGSNYRFYPDHGVAVISFANLTYAGTGTANGQVGALLLETAKLPRRVLPASELLAQRQRQVAALVQTWDPAVANAIVAENFFLDRTREAWRRHARDIFDRAGPVVSIGEIQPENQLRGTFALRTEKGRVDVFFTLTPEREPKVQELRLTFRAGP